jgi:hypothetical protein
MMKYNLGAELNLSTRDKVYMETSFQAWYHGVNGHPLVLDNNYFYGEPSIDASRLCSSDVISAMSSAYSKILIVSSLNFTPQPSSLMFSDKSFLVAVY